MTYTFNDRASYKTAIKVWAENYLALSEQIRKAKIAFKEAVRNGSGEWRARTDLESLQDQARSEISWRHGSKEEAHRQYPASRAGH